MSDIAFTPDQEYCIKLLDDWRGLHHLGPIKPWGRGIQTTVYACTLSTFDTDVLVLMSHDRCVRVELGNGGPSRTAIILHRRPKRTGKRPAEGEVGELVAKLRRLAPQNPLGGADPTLTRAADLLERLSPPQPVPVSERLPGPEDCDEEGRCWLRSKYQPDGPTWRLACLASIGTKALWFHYAEWLPAPALPLPVEVEG